MELSQDFVKRIEIHYLYLVLDMSRRKKIDRSTIKASAQLFLSYLPFKNGADIKHKMSNFKEIYPSFASLYTYILNELEKEQTEDVLEKMRHLMKNKDIDTAIELTDKK